MKNTFPLKFIIPFFILLLSTRLDAGSTDCINNSYLHYENIDNGATSDYYRYIVSLIKTVLSENDINVNINFGDDDYNFLNNNKIFQINYNYEHTLVKKGGRSVPDGCLFGKTLTNDNEYYHVRIDNYDKLNSYDIIIDYSLPNIYNISTSDVYNEFSYKMLYIAPLIYSTFNFEKQNRTNEIITTFINTNEPRRRKLLDRIQTLDLNHKNINNCFDVNELQNLYCNTKIMINIHQTDYHHTFEELRVLPALSCGILVVCEESPLSHLIPYNEYIIWSSYDKILEKVVEVSENYEYYHDKIFGKNNNLLFSELKKSNLEELKNKLINLK